MDRKIYVMTVNQCVDCDWIYSERTYSGLLEGMPNGEINERIISHAYDKAKSLRSDTNIFLLEENTKEEVLPAKTNIAYISDDCSERHLVLIWFDEYDKPLEESLKEAFSKINFKKESEEFIW